MRTYVSAVVLAAFLFAACEDGPAAPEPTGGVLITTSTAGLDVDPDGYSVAVDGGPPEAIAANDTVSIGALSVGSHSVALSNIAANCSVEGDNPRVVSVPEGSVRAVGFAVGCMATTGVIEITTATSGVDPDPTGYLLRVDGGTHAGWVNANFTATFGGVSGGDHVVTLEDVAANCTLDGSNQHAVSVSTGGLTRHTARTAFQLTCVRTEKIAFSRQGRITVAYADGSSAVDLISGDLPSWSPDGTQLVFKPDCSDYFTWYYGCPGLAVMYADGTDLAGLTTDDSDTDPAWHPHGARIAFTRVRNGRSTLYLMDVTGSELAPIQLPDSVLAAWQPHWSPDGARIVFTCQMIPDWTDICFVNADGTGFVRLTRDSWRDESPAWSPTGARVAFATNRDDPGGGYHIALMHADGSGITWIAAGRAPAWSRDGAKIVFAGPYDCVQVSCRPLGLSTVNPDGSGLVRLTSESSDDAPAWRP